MELRPLLLSVVTADLRAAFSLPLESERAVTFEGQPMSDEAKRKRIIRLPTPRHDLIPIERIEERTSKMWCDAMLLDCKDG